MKIWRGIGGIICAGGILLASTSSAMAVPITFNTALAISEKEWLLREQVIWAHVPDDPSGLGRAFDAITSVSVLGYGITPKLAIFGALPVAHKELQTSNGERSSDGIGDARTFVRYTIFQQDQAGQTFRISPFAGLEWSTGRNSVTDGRGLLPAAVQPGSGAVDVFAGIVATWASTKWQLDGQLSYQDNREASNREPGDVFKADLSWQYRLWPAVLTDGTDAFLFGVLEANFIYERKAKVNNLTDRNSGGTTLFIAPGLQYATEHWILEGAVQLPVVQTLNGTQLEKTFITRLSARFNF